MTSSALPSPALLLLALSCAPPHAPEVERRGPSCMLLGERKALPPARAKYSASPPEEAPPAAGTMVPVRLFRGDALEDAQLAERVTYKDDLAPPHHGTYLAYWNCISWIPVTEKGSCVCEHGPNPAFERDAAEASAVVWGTP